MAYFYRLCGNWLSFFQYFISQPSSYLRSISLTACKACYRRTVSGMAVLLPKPCHYRTSSKPKRQDLLQLRNHALLLFLFFTDRFRPDVFPRLFDLERSQENMFPEIARMIQPATRRIVPYWARIVTYAPGCSFSFRV